ncbi:SDR family NAD(P)-dependent oxidoreductase [Roseateles albus]|uniref:SDR family NAD(P)-dependent oxidoreductase n=1 Tax=Roseateles albus TaxID=2987525 RepID=A0ABT5KAX3_9BURK|nr:SDR family NAD(P)-dependent oxidoreductase [Roseateles albus]MDC8771087.1 SDR family NAD(P)-dependent oxidoreductase [Roseateles albus]
MSAVTSALALSGLHAAITGGGSGIGAAVAQRLVAAGARVSLLGRSLDKLQGQAAALAPFGQVDVCVLDVADEASVKVAFEQIGAVDILVNNAGQVETAPLAKTSLALWQAMLNVNLTGTFLCSREVVAGMSDRGFGRIINVASTAALTGYAYVAAYCAAKHGVLGLTRTMALEFAKKGVTVNAVCPGYTETDIVARALDNIASKTGRSTDEARAELVAANPQGRLVQPQEVADTVLWLAQRGSGAVTGQAIAVCGGELML